jgi:thiamine transport system permease protein
LPLTVARLLGQPGALNRGQAMAVATLLMVVTVGVVLAVDQLRGGLRD